MPNINKIIKKLTSSYTSRTKLDEALLLYKYARKTKGFIVEVGTCLAGSTTILGFANKSLSSRVYSVDISDKNHEENLQRIRKYRLKCNLIIDKSVNFAKTWRKWIKARKVGKLSMVYIDAGHSFKSAYRDMKYWVPLVKKGGFVLIHDYHTDPENSVVKAYKKFKESGYCKFLEAANCMAAFKNIKKEIVYA